MKNLRHLFASLFICICASLAGAQQKCEGCNIEFTQNPILPNCIRDLWIEPRAGASELPESDCDIVNKDCVRGIVDNCTFNLVVKVSLEECDKDCPDNCKWRIKVADNGSCGVGWGPNRSSESACSPVSVVTLSLDAPTLLVSQCDETCQLLITLERSCKGGAWIGVGTYQLQCTYCAWQ